MEDLKEKINQYCDKYGDEINGKISYPETLFLKAYSRFLKTKPQLREYACFHFSPLDFFYISEYLGYEAGQDIIFHSKKWPRDVVIKEGFYEVMASYRLQYVIDAIGSEKLSQIIDEMMDAKAFNLFERIAKTLGCEVDKIYTPLEKLPPKKVKLGSVEKAKFQLLRKWRLSNLFSEALHRAEQLIYLEELCSRPILVDFSKKERSEIIDTIYAMEQDEFVHNCDGVGYFLANFLLHETEWSLAEILPVAVYILTKTPLQHPDSFDDRDVAWLCSEVVERCGKILPNDPVAWAHFGDLVYQIYWPRIGSLWPLLHWSEFKFKEEFKSDDITEAVNYILNVDDIENRNRDIAIYFEFFSQKPVYLHRETENKELFYRGLMHHIKSYSPKERLDFILKETTERERDIFLNCPPTIDDAKVLLADLFHPNNCHFAVEERWPRLFGLVESQNFEGVGCYILGYLSKHLDEFVNGINNERKMSSSDEVITQLVSELFCKACIGISEVDELEPLAELGKKVYSYTGDKTKITKSYNYALLRQKTFTFQRGELVPMFQKPYNAKSNKEEI